jgi:hypothetical protein
MKWFPTRKSIYEEDGGCGPDEFILLDIAQTSYSASAFLPGIAQRGHWRTVVALVASVPTSHESFSHCASPRLVWKKKHVGQRRDVKGHPPGSSQASTH